MESQTIHYASCGYDMEGFPCQICVHCYITTTTCTATAITSTNNSESDIFSDDHDPEVGFSVIIGDGVADGVAVGDWEVVDVVDVGDTAVVVVVVAALVVVIVTAVIVVVAAAVVVACTMVPEQVASAGQVLVNCTQLSRNEQREHVVSTLGFLNLNTAWAQHPPLSSAV
jgi:hypothetical protein